MITKLTNGQQVTIPAKIRNKLNIKAGSVLEIKVMGNEIIICPIDENLEELFEQAKKIKPKKHLNAVEMDRLIENEVY